MPPAPPQTLRPLPPPQNSTQPKSLPYSRNNMSASSFIDKDGKKVVFTLECTAPYPDFFPIAWAAVNPADVCAVLTTAAREIRRIHDGNVQMTRPATMATLPVTSHDVCSQVELLQADGQWVKSDLWMLITVSDKNRARYLYDFHTIGPDGPITKDLNAGFWYQAQWRPKAKV